MSDVSDYDERLNLCDQVARIDQLIAETQKFNARRISFGLRNESLTGIAFWHQAAIVGIVSGLVAVADADPARDRTLAVE